MSGGAAAAAPPPDPVEEALQRLRLNGSVLVVSPDGGYEYEITRTIGSRPFSVLWRSRVNIAGVTFGHSWRDLNPGWQFHPATLAHAGTAEAVEAAAVTLLAAIFGGLNVWALRCGTQLDNQSYRFGG